VNKTLRVLIVDDDPMMARTLADILRVKGHKAEIAHSSAEALVLLDAGPFDCVLSDIRMPGANGVQLHREIVDRYASIPTVLMTAYSSDSLVQEGLDEGVLAVLTKPLDIGAVLAFLCSLRKEYSLVIVDDDPLFCRTLGDLLEARGFAVAAISDPYAVMDCLDENAGIVLLDVKLDGIDGVDVLRQIRARYPNLPVVLVTGYGAQVDEAIQAALELGAHACLYKPLQIDQLLDLLFEIRRCELGKVFQ